jgi:TonB family protein
MLRDLIERSDEPRHPLRELAAAALRLAAAVVAIVVLVSGVWVISRSSLPGTLTEWGAGGWRRLGRASDRVTQALSGVLDPAPARTQPAPAVSSAEPARDAHPVEATEVVVAPSELPRPDPESVLQAPFDTTGVQAVPPETEAASPSSTTVGASAASSPPGRRSELTAGAVEIRTAAAGIRVEIDGVVASRAPVRISNVPPGRHLLRVRGPDGERSQLIEVWPGQLTRVVLPAAVAAASGPATSRTRLAPLTAPPASPETQAVSASDASPIALPEPTAERPQVHALMASGNAFAADDIAPPQPINEHVPPIPMPFPRPRGSRVIVDLQIDESGRVKDAIVRESSAPHLDAAVIAAARGWRYQPARRAGVPVSSTRTVEIPLSNR